MDAKATDEINTLREATFAMFDAIIGPGTGQRSFLRDAAQRVESDAARRLLLARLSELENGKGQAQPKAASG